MAGRHLHTMSPMKLHFYRIYLWLYINGKPEDIDIYDAVVRGINYPNDQSRKKMVDMAQRMKSKAKNCPDREAELRLVDGLSLVMGNKVKEDSFKQFMKYVNLDPLRKPTRKPYIGGV